MEEAYRIVHAKKGQVTRDIADFKQKGYKKRAIYSGYSNWTELEKEWIVKVKDELRKNHNIDLDVIKPFGPRNPNSVVIEGTNPIVSGRDPNWREYKLLKYIVAYKFNMPNIIKNLVYHLEWRQTCIPRPILTDQTVKCMNKGLLYIHGRAMDNTPILIMDFVKLEEMIDNKEITPEIFCNLFAFNSTYLQQNMQV